MIYYCISLLVLAAVANGQCTDINLACPDSSGCTNGAQCVDANGVVVVMGSGTIGCCGGAFAPTTTVAPVTTTRAAVTIPCVDRLNPLTGVSDCPARAYLCTDSVYRNFMRTQCPRTCGYCSTTITGTSITGTRTSTCVDLTNPRTGVSDCPAMRSFCTNAVYTSLMRVQCPATCGFC